MEAHRVRKREYQNEIIAKTCRVTALPGQWREGSSMFFTDFTQGKTEGCENCKSDTSDWQRSSWKPFCRKLSIWHDDMVRMSELVSSARIAPTSISKFGMLVVTFSALDIHSSYFSVANAYFVFMVKCKVGSPWERGLFISMRWGYMFW